jgi:NAD(P)-dependent dehydrogenase (short-subunit alcohol dehydrogenase family)
MEDFNGRVAVVTGGGSGIGAAMARAFAREVAKVVLADVDPAGMERVSAEIASA